MPQNPVKLAVIVLVVFLVLSSLLGVKLTVLIENSWPFILFFGGIVLAVLYMHAKGLFYHYNALEEGVKEEKKTAMANMDKYHKFMPVYVMARRIGLLVGYTKGVKDAKNLSKNSMLMVGIPLLPVYPLDRIRISENLLCVPPELIDESDGVIRIRSSIIKKGYHWYAINDINLTTKKILEKNEDLCTWKILEERYKNIGTAMSSHIDSDKIHKERLQEKADVTPVGSEASA